MSASVADCLEELSAVFPRHPTLPFYGAIRRDDAAIGGIEFSEGTGGVIISHIHIDPAWERQGFGQEALTSFCEIADRHGCNIWLQAFWHPCEEDGGHLVR